MVLFCWIEESFIEGRLHAYLYDEGHVIFRSLFRLAYISIIFATGYFGLKALSGKWLVSLWVIWYVIVFVTAGIAKFPIVFLHHPMDTAGWNFLNGFYNSALTPFPYIFLLLLYFLLGKKTKSTSE